MKMSSKINELKKIPLAEFCIQKLGYKPSKDKDSRLWRSLLSPTGHKIVAKSTPTPEGHYLFFCANEDIRGSLVDLLISFHDFDIKGILNEFCDARTEFPVPKFECRSLKKDPKKITCDINLYHSHR